MKFFCFIRFMAIGFNGHLVYNLNKITHQTNKKQRKKYV